MRKMPAASKSNIHGYIHGKRQKKRYNAGGVEKNNPFNPLRG
jgi:hypothetical protein